MELISGVKVSHLQRRESEESFSPHVGMSELSPQSEQSKRKTIRWTDQNYEYRDDRVPESMHIANGLTPRASKQYEGVKNLY